MMMLSGQAIGQFIGDRLPRHVGAGSEQQLDRTRGGRCGWMRCAPVRIAETRAVPGDIKHILGREAAPVEHAVRTVRERDMIVATERAEYVVWKRAGRYRARVVVIPPVVSGPMQRSRRLRLKPHRGWTSSLTAAVRVVQSSTTRSAAQPTARP